jgi:hypothetical protein
MIGPPIDANRVLCGPGPVTKAPGGGSGLCDSEATGWNNDSARLPWLLHGRIGLACSPRTSIASRHQHAGPNPGTCWCASGPSDSDGTGPGTGCDEPEPDSERLGETRRDSERLAETLRVSDRLGETRRDSERLG